ncbi:hypothetical protein GCK72_006412 [Caenorhabditis remanei]|uniref:Uncharacterized protein n=1 Tax=Caenorhabditis remanei TaxID=31234 RepID=A0A6A5HG91_CAERE|nr:hypothetical protein GCK72_006412 [Caenorhabditis remanei]KAF1766455.1 hypothetical protein GCK72_006412 [Caenorhabditis remanei]
MEVFTVTLITTSFRRLEISLIGDVHLVEAANNIDLVIVSIKLHTVLTGSTSKEKIEDVEVSGLVGSSGGGVSISGGILLARRSSNSYSIASSIGGGVGFELIELSTFPDEVLQHAQQLAAELRAQVEDTERDYDSERRRVKVFMSHRLRESAEYFMEMHGEKWKEEPAAIEKMKSLRNYMIEELAKIDRQEQMSQESE